MSKFYTAIIILFISIIILIGSGGGGDTGGGTGGGETDDSDNQPQEPPPLSELTPIDSNNLEYRGSFNVPGVSSSVGATFAWAATGSMAYNPENNSLFMVGHDHHQLVGEISIPTPVISDNVSDLNRSELLQPLVDITEGHIAELGDGGASLSSANNNMKIGGLLVYNNNLYGTAFPYYESAGEETRSHFRCSLDLSETGDFSGMYTVGELLPGQISGYMGLIPEIWQNTFNATALTGNACICIISRSSFGPSVSTFSPEYLHESNPSHSKGLVYYPSEHKTLGEYENEDTARPVYNMTTKIFGVVFPKEASNILFFGRTGLAVPEYGAGTDDPLMDGQQVPGENEYYVYDPASPDSKGPHAWPYTTYIWAYSIEDLLSVSRGEKNPWEIVPDNHWSFELPFYDEMTSTCSLGGVAYDPSLNRIYISQLRVNGDRPVVHVYDLVGL